MLAPGAGRSPSCGAMPTDTTALIHLDPATVEPNFGRTAFAVQHELHGHPLTQLEALAELADSLPPERVEHNLGSVDDTMPGGEVPQAELSPGEMVRTIETNGCWMVLPIHGVPAYAELYDALFEDVLRALPAREGACNGARACSSCRLRTRPRRRTSTWSRATCSSSWARSRSASATSPIRWSPTARSSASAPAGTATSRTCRMTPRRSSSAPASACTFPRSSRTWSRRRRACRSRCRSASRPRRSIRRAAVHRANADSAGSASIRARPGERPRGDRAEERP